MIRTEGFWVCYFCWAGGSFVGWFVESQTATHTYHVTGVPNGYLTYHPKSIPSPHTLSGQPQHCSQFSPKNGFPTYRVNGVPHGDPTNNASAVPTPHTISENTPGDFHRLAPKRLPCRLRECSPSPTHPKWKPRCQGEWSPKRLRYLPRE